MEFYSTTAGLIAILMLAFTIENKSTELKSKKHQKAFDIISYQNQLSVFFWGSLGIAASLYKLSNVDLFGPFDGGMITILVSITVLLIYFLMQIIMKNAKENKKLPALVVAFGSLMIVPLIVGIVLVLIGHNPIDGLFIALTGLLTTITAGKNVTWNKDVKNFLR